MHGVMLLLALLLAYSMRCWRFETRDQPWQSRWSKVLTQFVVPPCLLLTTGLAIIWMGPEGETWTQWDGWLTYGLAWLGLGALGVIGWQLIKALILTQHRLEQYPTVDILGESGHLLETSFLFIARVGFWQSKLLVSRGLLNYLNPDHLAAVLVHEAAHLYYRDTFYFFWLGWLRRITFWLPKTNDLWIELLALRELRADHWAAQRVDGLLLAEALLLLVQAPLVDTCPIDMQLCASVISTRNNVVERVNLLLKVPDTARSTTDLSWLWLLLPLMPLLAIPFHCCTVC